MAERETGEQGERGSNGDGAESAGEKPQFVQLKIELSEAVKSWLQYCGRPVSVHLAFQILIMDWHGDVIDLPIDQNGRTVQLGVAGPALFRHVEGEKREKEPMFTDTLERAFIQPAPCGKRLVVSQKTQPELGLSGAVISYLIDPTDIKAISFVDRVPQRLVTPAGSSILTPGN